MLQKLPKFLEVAQKTASCPKVAEQLVDRANLDVDRACEGAFSRYGGSRAKSLHFTRSIDFARKMPETDVESSLFASFGNVLLWDDTKHPFPIFGGKGEFFYPEIAT